MKGREWVKYPQYPVLQIRPNLLLAYDVTEFPPRSRVTGEASPLENLKGKKPYSGWINSISAKKLKRSINLLVAAADWKTAQNFDTGQEFKFKVNFITLTLPAPQGEVTDKEIKKEILDVWLKMARRRFKLKNYVWRAERQKNGNIHFHITTDCFIWFYDICNTWNDRLERLGFITAFEKKHGHRNPNSTDVHSVNQLKNLAGYMVKYMSKGDYSKENLAIITGLKFPPGTRPHKRASAFLEQILLNEIYPIQGKVWDCSESLKQKIKCDMLMEDEARKVWDSAIAENFQQSKTFDRVTILPLSDEDFKRFVIGEPLLKWNEFLNLIKNYNANQLQTLPAKLEESHSSSNLETCPF